MRNSKFILIILLFTALLVLTSCTKEKTGGTETLISFEGGEITSADVEKRAGEHLARLRKKQEEIISRIAMEILIEELDKREGKGATGIPANTRIDNKDKSAPVGATEKNGTESKPVDIPDKDLKKLFSKYNVKSFLKSPGKFK